MKKLSALNVAGAIRHSGFHARGGGGGGAAPVELLDLPHGRGFDDQTIGEAGGTAPAWYNGETQTASVIALDDTGEASNNLYVDQAWHMPAATSPDYSFGYIDLGAALPTDGFRIMWSMCRTGSYRDCTMLAKLSVNEPLVADTSALQFQCTYGADKYLVHSWDAEGNVTAWAEQSWGVNHQADGWKHTRAEVDPDTGIIMAKTGDNLSVAWEYQKTIAWESGYEIPEGLRYLTSYNSNTGMLIGYVWIGSLTDAWPTGNPVT